MLSEEGGGEGGGATNCLLYNEVPLAAQQRHRSGHLIDMHSRQQKTADFFINAPVSTSPNDPSCPPPSAGYAF